MSTITSISECTYPNCLCKCTADYKLICNKDPAISIVSSAAKVPTRSYRGMVAIETILAGEQQYTLKVRVGGITEREVICSYHSSAILTTDYAALIAYAQQLAALYPRNIYTIARVSDASAILDTSTGIVTDSGAAGEENSQ